ncbi:MAG TPA: M13 family metallopeptidase [Bacteroidota bacterium]|nr:M13 family metallopeptidase [Bacteroidota bacterium]
MFKRAGFALMIAGIFIVFTGLHFAHHDGTKPIDMQNFDLSVKPADDFYQYANGGWISRNPIPPDESRWGSFNEVQERNYVILHELLESAAANTSASPGSIAQKVGDFYFSAMDSAQIEGEGIKPLEPELERISAMKDGADLQLELAHLQALDIAVPFNFTVSQDAKNSKEELAQIYQAGLGLPDRDYYLKSDDHSKETRDQYVGHIARIFSLIGEDAGRASADAITVMKIETRLAKAAMARVELRDPNKTYHKMSIQELATLAPAISWHNYLDAIGAGNAGYVNVGQPDFLKDASHMVGDIPLADWKAYLQWHLVHFYANFLSSPFEDASFEFYGKVLTGQKEQRPRWKRALAVVDECIGEALGQLYVEKAFSPQAKARAVELVANLRSALRERIQNLDWMSAETKAQAVKKLDAFMVKIGYPDKWRDYSYLKIDRGSYVLNVMRSHEFEFRRVADKLGKPVDRTEWTMTPPTVNAYYNSRMNEIVFPAGILQPPFFYANGDDGVNYGGIGAVIGHEMTHGFDDAGSRFDADGNLKNWWTQEDSAKYATRTRLVQQQFDGYVAVDTIHVNGRLTLGENIADLGGLTVAYAAMEKALEGKSRDKIDGFTPEQRFFLSFAQIWRQNIRPEAQRLRILTDPHSPGRFRCIGPLSNMVEFLKAFNVPDGAAMARKPDERARIW